MRNLHASRSRIHTRRRGTKRCSRRRYHVRLMSEPERVAGWVRVLDVLCVLLALVAAIVALSGGFRVQVGGVRVGVTTPLPLLLWALALGIVRHIASPREPLYREVPRRLIEWARVPAV